MTETDRFTTFALSLILFKEIFMKKAVFLSVLLLGINTAEAKVQLPQQIGDHMVLQQQTDANLWGEAAPNASVSIVSSWSDKAYSVKADAAGLWKAAIETPVATFCPQTISISDGEAVTLRDVLIGEVWLCSGQSNMEMPLNGFGHSPVLDANHTIADAGNHPGIRMATIERKGAVIPQAYANGSWKVSNPENAQWFSAVAYHYALTLQRTLNVPVGIIACAWGGSRVEGWLPKEILATYPDEDLSRAGSKEGTEYMQPMIMYNGLLKPLTNYTIKGFAWYQGCSNVGHETVYAQRLATMVKHWRSLWGLGDIPFYFTEIAPYDYDGGDGDGISGALLREAQVKAQLLIPNSAVISTNDLVKPFESAQIHPANKTDVGQRLAYHALNKTYGYTGIAADAPTYQKMEIGDGKVELYFNHAEDGFTPWKAIEGFEIAGADRVFHPATAGVNQWKGTVTVFSEEVPDPVAVRYCFRNFRIGNLVGSRNLPVIPFRTDNW
ncbi:hypothetical protein Barb6_02926 [Bacteroidales bacterium Barb6]|nr:hypothetical protein Barb6_02926 [Bacteroidales bacterium Barb6]